MDVDDVNRRLRPLFGQYEDSFQEAWVEILEGSPQTIHDLAPIARKVRNRAIKQYLNKKYRKESLHRPLGQNGDGSFTLESILESPTYGNSDGTDEDKDGGNGFLQENSRFSDRRILEAEEGKSCAEKGRNALKAERLGCAENCSRSRERPFRVLEI